MRFFNKIFLLIKEIFTYKAIFMTDTISQDKYSKELIELDFPEKLLASPESGNLLEYCKKHDMKYLKKSDGLLVNVKFDKHFKVSECIKMRNKLSRKGHLYEKEDIKLPLENINLLRSKTEEKVFILISSPLEDMDMIDAFKKYPYDIYVIRPDFLDYYAFIEEGSRQEEKVNYAFTNAKQSQIQHVNEMIYQDTGLSDVFKKYIF